VSGKTSAMVAGTRRGRTKVSLGIIFDPFCGHGAFLIITQMGEQ
jgi:tRNA G10  N-methylase Trm11